MNYVNFYVNYWSELSQCWYSYLVFYCPLLCSPVLFLCIKTIKGRVNLVKTKTSKKQKTKTKSKTKTKQKKKNKTNYKKPHKKTIVSSAFFILKGTFRKFCCNFWVTSTGNIMRSFMVHAFKHVYKTWHIIWIRFLLRKMKIIDDQRIALSL